VIWALILRNPLSSFLGALLLTLGVYTGYLKLNNAYLTVRVDSLENIEKQRHKQVVEAFKRNAIKAEQNKRFTKGLQDENERLHAQTKPLIGRIDVLTRKLRDAQPCSLSTLTRTAESRANPATDKLPDTGRDIFDRLVIEYADLAKSAEVVRLQAQTCQAFIKGQ
jgi:hypothetical protein